MIPATSVSGSVAASGASGWIPPFDYASMPGYIVDVSADHVTLNGGAVSQLTDRSGNDHHFSQASGSDQPTYEATGWSDGSPSVLFDGTDDYLLNTTSLAADMVGGDNKPFTLYVVVQLLVDGPTGATIVGFGSTSDLDPICRIADNGGTGGNNLILFKRNDDQSASVNTGNVPYDLDPALITIVHSGTATAFRLNGSTIWSGAQNVGQMTVDRAALGGLFRVSSANFFFNMRLKRMLGYAAEHNSDQYGAVETALLAEHF